MRALALVALLALPALAQDVPVAEPRPVVLKAGDAVPYDGLLLSDAQAIDAAKRLAASEAKAKTLEEGLKSAPAWWVVPLVAVVALGVGAGIGVAASR